MRKPAVAVLVSVVALALLAVPSAARLEKAEATTAAMIQDVYNRGELSHDEMMLQKAYSIYAPWKVREDLAGGMIEKCGNPVADELWRELPNLSPEVADEIRSLRARPNTQTYVETAHFRIHYDTTGSHTILSTGYRDDIMVAAEYVWDGEVTDMGFRAPPPDGSDPDGGGGNDLYDIYVQNLGLGLYGYCQPTYYYSGGDYPANAATSYLVIDNDYAGFGYPDPADPMRVTVAHEFSHAIQNAHDVGESTWYKECTSTWVEDIIYDNINDYTGYLSSFLNSLYRSIDFHDGNLRWYGSCVWNFFLNEYFDTEIVKDIWYQCEGSSPTLTMFDIVLAGRGSSLEEAYHTFATWCYFTGARNDGNHFEEAGTWYTASIMRGHSIYPIAIGGPTPGWEPDHLGCNFIQFNYTGSGYDGLLVSYDGPALATVPNTAFLNRRTAAYVYGEYGEIPLNPWGVGDLTVEVWSDMQNVSLVVANCSTNSNDMNYSYNAEEVETGIEDAEFSFGLKTAAPNPFAESTSIAYSVPTGGGLVDIVVYDVNGREVRSLVNERRDSGAGVAVWDGLDNRGERVASGVYFARLDIDGATASGKLIMLK